MRFSRTHSASRRLATLCASLIFVSALLIATLPVRATSVAAGYRDFSFGSGVTSSPTGEKPESKLWWNDGFWWASLINPSVQGYHIYRFDLPSQGWVDTGTPLDNRGQSKADALWDASSQKLYVASHIFAEPGAPTTDPGSWSRLYRYSYSLSAKSYSLDADFPVTVSQATAEAMTVAKDSTGRLWVTWTERNQVRLNHSLGSDSTWGTPFSLPFADAVNLNWDDISAMLAFAGNKVGVMWSNQSDKKMHFAVHVDGDSDTAWQPEETALPGPGCSGKCADDHINLKSVQADSTGRVFAAIKTSLTLANAPQTMLLVRGKNGAWSSYAFGRVKDGHTRPIVLLDEEHARVYMFATANGAIYYKTTDINNIQFPLGVGTPFIQSTTDTNVNNATSTKQNVDTATGLLVIAGDSGTKYYLHNYLALAASSPTDTPTSTPTATAVNPPTNTPTATPVVGPTPTNTPAFTPSPTAAASDLIFADGFESGSFSAWYSASTNAGSLSVSPAAALLGSYGLQAVISNTTAMYVQDRSAKSEPRYRARFYFNPNGITMADGDMHTIFYGFSSGVSVLRIDFRNNAGAYQVQARLLDNASTWSATPWFTITNAPHSIEFDWQAAIAAGSNNGSLTLWLDGVQVAGVAGVSNDTRRIDMIRLGPVTGLDPGTSGTEYFDAFESRRQTYIGP